MTYVFSSLSAPLCGSGNGLPGGGSKYPWSIYSGACVATMVSLPPVDELLYKRFILNYLLRGIGASREVSPATGMGPP